MKKPWEDEKAPPAPPPATEPPSTPEAPVIPDAPQPDTATTQPDNVAPVVDAAPVIPDETVSVTSGVQAPLALINLVSQGVPMAEAKRRLGME